MSIVHIILLTGFGLALGIVLWLGFLYWSKVTTSCFRHLFIAALTVGLVVRVAYLIGTPTFYAPDEQSHFNYIKFISENRSLPVQTSKIGDPTIDWEYHQPPLYYMAMVPFYSLSNALCHDESITVRAIRIVSIVLWLVSVWLAFRFVRYLNITDDFLRIFPIALVCLLPTYTFLSSAINNDNLLITIGGVILCIVARREPSLRMSILEGVLLGTALLTKFTAVVYFPPIAIMSASEIARNRSRWLSAVARLSLIFLIAAFIWSPWALRNWHLYSSLTAEGITSVPKQWESIFHAIDSTVSYMMSSFWAVSGIYNNVRFPSVGIVLSYFAFAGLVYCVASRNRYSTALVSEENRAFFIAMALAIAINAILVLRFGILYGQGQGRFLLPLLFPISLFIAIGLRPYPVKNLCVHVICTLITYALAFTLFSLGIFTRAV